MSSISSYQGHNPLFTFCALLYIHLCIHHCMYFHFLIFLKENNMLIVTLKQYFKAIALKYMLIYKEKKYYLILSNQNCNLIIDCSPGIL